MRNTIFYGMNHIIIKCVERYVEYNILRLMAFLRKRSLQNHSNKGGVCCKFTWAIPQRWKGWDLVWFPGSGERRGDQMIFEKIFFLSILRCGLERGFIFLKREGEVWLETYLQSRKYSSVTYVLPVYPITCGQ